MLTKGDNNPSDDVSLYAHGQDYLERKDIIGSVMACECRVLLWNRGFSLNSLDIPFVGYVTIMLSEHPWMKTAMLGIMGVLVILQRE